MFFYFYCILTLCPGSSDPFYVATYYMKWDTTSWTYSTMLNWTIFLARRRVIYRGVSWWVNAYPWETYARGWQKVGPGSVWSQAQLTDWLDRLPRDWCFKFEVIFRQGMISFTRARRVLRYLLIQVLWAERIWRQRFRWGWYSIKIITTNTLI